MRRAVTNCAVFCLLLTIAERSMANVSVPLAESWSELESYVLDVGFGLAVPFTAESLWTLDKPAITPDGEERSLASSDSARLAWSGISTRAEGYPGPGKDLPPKVLSSLYSPNPAYACVDSGDLGEMSAIDGLVFQPTFPSGPILLGGLAVGLIGWSWRRRNLFFEEYP